MGRMYGVIYDFIPDYGLTAEERDKEIERLRKELPTLTEWEEDWIDLDEEMSDVKEKPLTEEDIDKMLKEAGIDE